MKGKSIGDEVDFYCTRCKLNLHGNVASVVNGEVKKVTCRTCHFTVAFKREKSDAEFRAQKLKRAFALRDRRQQAQVAGADRGAATGGTEVTKRWRKLTDDVDARFAPRYQREKSYDEGDLVIHKQYGLGIVQQVLHEQAFVAIFRTIELPLEMNASPDEDEE